MSYRAPVTPALGARPEAVMSDKTEKPGVERVKVVVSDDRLKAHIHLIGTSTPSWRAPTAAETLAALQQARILVTDAVRANVDALVAECEAAAAKRESAGGKLELPESFVVAEGTPSRNAKDGRFEWSEAMKAVDQPTDEHDRVDYFAVSAITSVSAGTEVGRIIPPEDGTVGEDVYGEPKQPRKPHGAAVKLGAGLAPASDGSNRVIAQMDGRVLEVGGEVRLSETLEISGDIDFNSGSIDAVIDVHVGGVVRAGFSVKTTRCLIVDKLIEAAEVDVGENIVVRGGVFGRDGHGFVQAGGEIAAAFFDEARVKARGDIRFNKEILNSRIRTLGRLASDRGTIIGGDVHARNGIEVSVLGSEANVITPVSIGTDVNALRRSRQMEREVKELQKSADHIRQTIQPLMANLKRLTPEQRERVTELMCKADEIELKQMDVDEAREKLMAEATPEAPASLLLRTVAHPGTHIVIEGREVTVQRPLHGPVRVELRKVKSATEVVAVNQNTGSITVLPAVDVDLDVPPEEETPAQEGVPEHESDKSTADKQ